MLVSQHIMNFKSLVSLESHKSKQNLREKEVVESKVQSFPSKKEGMFEENDIT